MPNHASARARRFHAYVERLTMALGHQDRHGPLRDYVTGLGLPGERKSIGPVAAWVVDDTGIPKKGQHSVGVARQYCGVLGKQDNCQVAVSVSVAHERASVPVAYRLYVPEAWAQDRRRRRAAGVPDTITFRPKWQIALEQITHLTTDAVP